MILPNIGKGGFHRDINEYKVYLPKKVKIKDMETSHIENTIKLLKRNPKFYDEEYGYYDIFDNENMYEKIK